MHTFYAASRAMAVNVRMIGTLIPAVRADVLVPRAGMLACIFTALTYTVYVRMNALKAAFRTRAAFKDVRTRIHGINTLLAPRASANQRMLRVGRLVGRLRRGVRTGHAAAYTRGIAGTIVSMVAVGCAIITLTVRPLVSTGIAANRTFCAGKFVRIGEYKVRITAINTNGIGRMRGSIRGKRSLANRMGAHVAASCTDAV